MIESMPPTPPSYRPSPGAKMEEPAKPNGFVWTSNKTFPWEAKDKLLHFATGTPGGAIVFWLMNGVWHVNHPWVSTLVVGILVGLAKEAWDMKKGGNFEFADAANTALGFAAGATLIRFVF